MCVQLLRSWGELPPYMHGASAACVLEVCKPKGTKETKARLVPRSCVPVAQGCEASDPEAKAKAAPAAKAGGARALKFRYVEVLTLTVSRGPTGKKLEIQSRDLGDLEFEMEHLTD